MTDRWRVERRSARQTPWNCRWSCRWAARRAATRAWYWSAVRTLLAPRRWGRVFCGSALGVWAVWRAVAAVWWGGGFPVIFGRVGEKFRLVGALLRQWVGMVWRRRLGLGVWVIPVTRSGGLVVRWGIWSPWLLRGLPSGRSGPRWSRRMPPPFLPGGMDRNPYRKSSEKIWKKFWKKNLEKILEKKFQKNFKKKFQKNFEKKGLKFF